MDGLGGDPIGGQFHKIIFAFKMPFFGILYFQFNKHNFAFKHPNFLLNSLKIGVINAKLKASKKPKNVF